ncbi:hypothetical protein Bca4012_015259 [Brassica carinata]
MVLGKLLSPLSQLRMMMIDEDDDEEEHEAKIAAHHEHIKDSNFSFEVYSCTRKLDIKA